MPVAPILRYATENGWSDITSWRLYSNNQPAGRIPTSADAINVNGKTVNIDMAGAVCGGILIGVMGGTFVLNGNSLDIFGGIQLQSPGNPTFDNGVNSKATITITGTIEGGTSKILRAGDIKWLINNGANTLEMRNDSSNANQWDLGEVELSPTSTGPVIFRYENSDSTPQFLMTNFILHSGNIMRINNVLNTNGGGIETAAISWVGEQGNLITVGSYDTSMGRLKVTGTNQTVSYCNISRINAGDGNTILAPLNQGNVDGLNNINVNFSSPSPTPPTITVYLRYRGH